MEGAIFCPPLAYEVSIEMIKRCGQSTEYLAGGGKTNKQRKTKHCNVHARPAVGDVTKCFTISVSKHIGGKVRLNSVLWTQTSAALWCDIVLSVTFFFSRFKKKKKSEMLSSINTEDHGRQTKGGCHSMIMMNYFRNIYDGVICSIKHYTGASH